MLNSQLAGRWVRVAAFSKPGDTARFVWRSAVNPQLFAVVKLWFAVSENPELATIKFWLTNNWVKTTSFWTTKIDPNMHEKFWIQAEDQFSKFATLLNLDPVEGGAHGAD